MIHLFRPSKKSSSSKFSFTYGFNLYKLFLFFKSRLPVESEDSLSDSDLTLKDRNEVNNMITDLYRAKQPPPQQQQQQQPGQPQTSVNGDQAIQNETQVDKSPQKVARKRRMIENDLMMGDLKRPGAAKRNSNDLVKSSINFGCFACDTQMKEV